MKQRLCIARGLIVGGNANNSSNAGFACVNANNAPSNTNANIGSRHYWIIYSYANPAHMAKKYIGKRALVVKNEEDQKNQQSRKMKRYGNLFNQVIRMENILLAYKKAIRGKRNTYGVNKFSKALGCNLLKLHNDLASGDYRTGEYRVFKIYEPKERDIYCLTFNHRIVHHAIMNILEPIWTPIFTNDTFSCIKGRGIHLALKRVKKALQIDPNGTRYCLKFDIQKFYPSIDHGVLKLIIRKKIKCKRLLMLLDDIVDSAQGVPIGNYLSQFFANLYLAYFDHDIKEKMRIRYYFRYADDIVVLAGCKKYLHKVLFIIREKLKKLKLSIKGNYQIFPIDARGLDFIGYVIYHTHVLLRKSIKKEFARKVAKGHGYGSKSWWSYYGWASHCDSKNLIKKLMNS